jgi:hypothetical protein
MFSTISSGAITSASLSRPDDIVPGLTQYCVHLPVIDPPELWRWIDLKLYRPEEERARERERVQAERARHEAVVAECLAAYELRLRAAAEQDEEAAR